MYTKLFKEVAISLSIFREEERPEFNSLGKPDLTQTDFKDIQNWYIDNYSSYVKGTNFQAMQNMYKNFFSESKTKTRVKQKPDTAHLALAGFVIKIQHPQNNSPIIKNIDNSIVSEKSIAINLKRKKGTQKKYILSKTNFSNFLTLINKSNTPKLNNEKDEFKSPDLPMSAHSKTMKRNEVKAVNYYPFDDLFFTPPWDQIIERKKELSKLESLSKKWRLILIDGVLGSGKSYLLKSFQEKCVKLNLYNRVFWKQVEDNLTLDILIAEIETKLSLGSLSLQKKAARLLDYMEENKFLLVLDDFEKAHEGSFQNFLRYAVELKGSSSIIIIANNKAKFNFIKDSNRFLVEGLSIEQTENILKKNKILLSKRQHEQIFRLTDGLPFYIDIFIQLSKNGKILDGSTTNKLLVQHDIKNWVFELSRQLTTEENRLLGVLCLINESFTTKDILEVAKKLNLLDIDNSFESLQNYHIVQRTAEDKWKVLQIICDTFKLKIDIKEKAKIHTSIAEHWICSVEINKTGNLKIAEIWRVCNGIAQYQLAGNFKNSNTELKKIIPILKRYNLYPQLFKLLQHEIEHNQFRDIWFDWHFSHSCFVTGRINEFYVSISKCLELAFDKINNSQQTKLYKTFFIKTMLLYTEFVGSWINYSDAQNILTTSLSIFKPMDLDYKLRSHAISILSWFYIKTSAFEKASLINRNILKDSYDENKQSIAIANTRLGIISFLSKDYETAALILDNANKKFKDHVDYRGYAWSLTYLSMSLYLLRKKEAIPKMITSIIEIHQEIGYFDKEYLDWLDFFKNSNIDKPVKELVKKELNQISQKYSDIMAYLKSSMIDKEIVALLNRVTTLSKNLFSFRDYVAPVTESTIPMRSELSKTLIKNIKNKPENFLMEIYSKPLNEVFKNIQTNKIITECMKLAGYRIEILSKLIFPALQLIKTQIDYKDSIKLHYAYALQCSGENEYALNLLDVVREEYRHFYYYNIKANCFRSLRIFNKSEKNYLLATIMSENSKEKAIALHNRALLIYELNKRSKFKESIAFCLEAIQLRDRDLNFIKHVVNTMFFVEIELCSLESVLEVANRIKSIYLITPERLNYVINNVRNILKRETLKKNFILNSWF